MVVVAAHANRPVVLCIPNNKNKSASVFHSLVETYLLLGVKNRTSWTCWYPRGLWHIPHKLIVCGSIPAGNLYCMQFPSLYWSILHIYFNENFRDQNINPKDTHYGYSLMVAAVPGPACLGPAGAASSLCTGLCQSRKQAVPPPPVTASCPQADPENSHTHPHTNTHTCKVQQRCLLYQVFLGLVLNEPATVNWMGEERETK